MTSSGPTEDCGGVPTFILISLVSNSSICTFSFFYLVIDPVDPVFDPVDPVFDPVDPVLEPVEPIFEHFSASRCHE